MSNKNVRAAIFKARETFNPVKKDAKNTHYGQRYPTLQSVLDGVEDALRAQGIEILPGCRYDELHGNSVLTTELVHLASGESEPVEIKLPNIDDPQKIGSAITYYRRYSLGLKLNVIPDDDDDGNRASGKAPAAKPVTSTPAPKKVNAPPTDPNDPEMGQEGYNLLLDRFKKMCETLGDDVLEQFATNCGVPTNMHYSETKAPRPFLLKAYLMSHGVKFDKATNTATGLAKSKYDAVTALLDSIALELSSEGFEDGDE